MIGQRVAQAEHELKRVAERLAEKEKQTKVSGQVDAREKRRERVVDEERAVEDEIGLVGEENVRDGERYLTHEKNEHDGDEHERDVAIEASRRAELTFARAYLEQLVDDERVHAHEHQNGQAEHERYVEIDAR